MTTWLERVRAALAPKGYDVERVLASGGMGTVFLARQRALDRLVAVKIIRPELYTAQAAERFRQEAQTLASFSHPNIVPIHDADEAEGMPYYVMDFLVGETVADGLVRGPLPPARALKLGRDLLDALEAAHRRGVVHRDVKPANVFLVGERAVLVDFGIAKRQATAGRGADDALPVTQPGTVIGTLDYMPPEQAAGDEVTERTDLYAAGMVIYEAFTGRHWFEAQREGSHRVWQGVPGHVARVLRLALERDPADRWPDAASFRHALWRTRVWRYRRNTIGVAVGCTLAGMAIVVLWTAPPTTVRLEVGAASSIPGLAPWLADSVACGLARDLDRYPALSADCGSGFARYFHRASHLAVDIEQSGGGVRLRVASALPGLDTIDVRGRAEQWPVLIADLADRVFGSMLGTPKLLDRSLPAAVLPKTQPGLLAFRRAERLFAEARWAEARGAYAAATAIDSTCWLCYLRHAEVGRWLDLEDDPRDNHYLAHVDAFPLPYQRLIRAQQLPLAARLDSLDGLTRRWRDFLFGQFRRGDELLHRGPLVGRSRREALAPFEDVLKFQPAFGPALEHLAWVHIVEGDSARATAALAGRERLGNPSDPPSFATLALVELAYAWRFLPSAEAARRTDGLVRQAKRVGVTQLDAGARYLGAFGVPQGELVFAERLLHEPGFERSASLARVLALVALGRPDTAIALARRLARRSPELAIFAEELHAATLLFDADSARLAAELPSVRARLADEFERPGPADRRRRAAWMVAVLDRVRSPRADPPPSGRLADEQPPPILAGLLEADALARRGAYGAALASTDGLAGVPAARTEDPFFRAVLHLSRAEWYERAGQLANGHAELIWHENSDVFRYPTGDPQAAEVDWAFAPLAEWRLARLVERSPGSSEEACRAYRTVARLWADGEPRYRARADTAAQRLAALRCEAA